MCSVAARSAGGAARLVSVVPPPVGRRRVAVAGSVETADDDEEVDGCFLLRDPLMDDWSSMMRRTIGLPLSARAG